MRSYFGTDGIRGRANTHPMTAEIAMKVGMAAGIAFNRGSHRHRVVIGKDTRLSGYMIENALVAGFTAAGVDVFLVGPMPTPAVAMLTRSLRCDIGVMISASHNPFEDNGIKLFGPDGYKLSDELEHQIELLIEEDLSRQLATSHELGRAKRIDGVHDRYIEFAKRTLPKDFTLDGLRVAIGAPTALPTRSRRRCSGSSAPRWWPSAWSRMASTSTSIAGRPTPSRCLPRFVKCGPTSGSRSTATPIGFSSWTNTATSSTATS